MIVRQRTTIDIPAEQLHVARVITGTPFAPARPGPGGRTGRAPPRRKHGRRPALPNRVRPPDRHCAEVMRQ